MSYQKLREVIDPNSPKAIYLALQPQHYSLAIQQLKTQGLLQPDTEIFAEKPLAINRVEGENLLSFLEELKIKKLNLVESFNLKETISNVIAFRASTPFESLLNKDNVKEIRIYALEQIIVPSERVFFFDRVGGQLPDMMSHLLAMTTSLLTKLPENLDISNLREGKEEAAQALQVIDSEETIFGQYQGYPTPTTSTFTAFTLACQLPRWEGVKIKGITEKAAPKKYCGMEFIFQEQSQIKSLFGDIKEPRLVFRHYPNEGITFHFHVKRPGAGMELVPAKLEFTYENTFKQVNQPAYLRLLSDILAGDKSSFASPFEALQALRIADTLQKDCVPSSFVKYDIGTYPEAAKDWLPSEWG
jgi:Glucose-6-phosphate 1-dehydrogenase